MSVSKVVKVDNEDGEKTPYARWFNTLPGCANSDCDNMVSASEFLKKLAKAQGQDQRAFMMGFRAKLLSGIEANPRSGPGAAGNDP